MADKLYTVYGLRAENSDQIKYIGITCQKLNIRLGQHINDKYKCKKSNWIKVLENENLKPVIEIIHEDITKEEANKLEIHYIKLFKSFGCELLNMNDGGSLIHREKLTKEHKKNISKAKLGKKFSEKHKKNLRRTRFDFEKIITLYQNGHNQYKIAELFNTSQGVISAILKYGRSSHY